LGIGLAGALSAAGGAILAQNQSFADVNMGFGVLVNGLAAVIVASGSPAPHARPPDRGARLSAPSCIIQVVEPSRWRFGMQPSDLRLLAGLFVLIMLVGRL